MRAILIGLIGSSAILFVVKVTMPLSSVWWCR